MTNSTGSVWLWRGWFGIALWLACEGVLWRSVAHPPLDWLVMAAGYALISMAALDFVVRYRARDAIGLMALTVCIVPLIGLLIAPHNTLSALPEHLFSRVVGAYGLMLLGVFGLLAFLLGGGTASVRRLAFAYSIGMGFLAGVWSHAAHSLSNWGDFPARLSDVMLVYALIGSGVVLGGAILARRAPLPPAPSFQLSARGWVLVALGLVLILLLQIVREAYTGPDLLGVAIVSVLGWLALWFEREEKGKIFLERLLASPRPSRLSVLIVWACFGVGLALGWQIPPMLEASIPPVTALEVGFVVLGFGWLPFLTVWIAAHALEREARRLDI